MNQNMYLEIEKHMLSCMNDSAHDRHHIYRVLFLSLDIVKEYENVDKDVLMAACLLHDIGRKAQFADPKCDHAEVGSNMAYEYLCGIRWREEKANHVKDCISTHRFRNDNPPISFEAKILYDADKLDVTGAIGIARTLMYQGKISEPLYSVDAYGAVLDGMQNELPSFFQEYHWKLKNIHGKFFTNRARLIAEERRKASVVFYDTLYKEVSNTHVIGMDLLKEALT